MALKDKTGRWLLKDYEDRFKAYLVPHLPGWLETYHLTYLTLVWSGFMVMFFYLGVSNPNYLFGVPAVVILQYLTDLLDGAVGRYRNTGLVKWGYYADHFFDFIFMTAIVLGYGLLIGFDLWLFALYAITSGFMVHTFLLVSTNNAFNMGWLGIGPTEGRLIFIILHLILIWVGIDKVAILLPYLVVTAGVGLLILFFSAQANLWKIDMYNK